MKFKKMRIFNQIIQTKFISLFYQKLVYIIKKSFYKNIKYINNIFLKNKKI